MQNEQDKKSDIKLWDLVKNSTKKLKANNDFSSPKKGVSKTTLPSSNQNILNSINTSAKKENFDIRNIEKINSTLNFINESNKGGVRNKDLKKLRSGKFTVQSKLDLHGYKLLDAEKIFHNFVIKSHQQGNRNLLIITGKGQDGEGKIRKSLHTWINKIDLSKLVIFYSHASPKDGGFGAYYIRLRKIFKWHHLGLNLSILGYKGINL